MRSNITVPLNRCACNNNATASITLGSVTDCSCQVEFTGLCPLIDFSKLPIIDEGTCDASNRERSPFTTLPTTQCNNEFEYLVAVVAANKNASLLVNLQTYQAMNGYYFGVSLMALLLVTASYLMF